MIAASFLPGWVAVLVVAFLILLVGAFWIIVHFGDDDDTDGFA